LFAAYYCIQRIRGITHYALYKFTYLLTYLGPSISERAGDSDLVTMVLACLLVGVRRGQRWRCAS